MHHLARSVFPLAGRHLLPRSPKRVVVIGGGPTGLYAADRLRHHFEVTVVDAKEYFEYTPGVLRALVNPQHHAQISFDYNEVLEQQLGVEFICGEALDLDASACGQREGSVMVKSTRDDSLSRLSFDYCVVAVGVSNGRWKPRMLRKEVAEESAFAPEHHLQARRQNLRAWRESISGAHRAIIVGSGLVGVELAGELAHFFPRLKVRLVDGAPTVLPQLAESARSYAHDWLLQNGVKMYLGAPFDSEAVGEDDLVIWAVGSQTRAGGIFSDAAALKQNGRIRVNRRMQALRRVGGGGSLDSINDPLNSAGTPAELEPIGDGKVFAIGDAAAVEGVPTAQMIYHGEEMAAVAVANIEAAEEISSPFAFGKARREAESDLQLLCCTSLGPQDGMFSTQSELITTGGFAAFQKQAIEDTKMRALQGELASSLLWYPVH